jgi:hypothetical protein
MQSMTERFEAACKRLGFSPKETERLIQERYQRDGEQIAKQSDYLVRLIRGERFSDDDEKYWKRYWEMAEEARWEEAIAEAHEESGDNEGC